MFRRFNILAFLLCTSFQFVVAQQTHLIKIHSHNDYHQTVPFWNAYSNGLHSIEVDIYLKNDTLYATHGVSEIIPGRTIETLYLQPLKRALTLQLGEHKHLQLLIDIKSEAYATLNKLIAILDTYPTLINNPKVSFVISGNEPKLKDFTSYPDYIQFDYQSLNDINDKAIWDKIALISLSFKTFSAWNGYGRLTAPDYIKVKTAIDKAHSYNKPFRYWATPDSKTAWKALSDLGVDFINTDNPYGASAYLNTLSQRVYYNKTSSKVYTPTYKSDKTETPIKQVILLIGDGNGLTQISSSVLANGGQLTLTQLKSIGFLKTQSADDFTTDSAAAGTALATGSKTYNRAIGIDVNGLPIANITEVLSEKGVLSGCITTDKITGATPASFYGHQKDRDHIKEIANDLLTSKLSLFIGGGANIFKINWDSYGFSIIKQPDDISRSTADKIGYFMAEDDVPSILEGRGNLLADATRNGLTFLHAKNTPFFLMVEAAKIDSYGHDNNVSGIVSEGIDFDKAITEAIKFADQTGDTLVIVTADHETSGYSIPQGNLKNKMIEGSFTTHDHTGTMVPIFAYGPYSHEFTGVYENNEVFHKILKVLDLHP
ncbi:alkaline phosphatase [Aestuariivivens sediminis]|uniref:alkaline phosphatase n=1 Tax=Aestuariivivens sediminis TaxID=2913557 RepID=UPI001F5685B0|nr:alkaline phosphatase [Aestuariivivens sediminis]